MSTSGNFLLDFSFDRTVFANCLAMSQVVDDSQIEKLHKKFTLCSSERLHALLRKAGVSVTVDRVKSVINDCDVCQRFGVLFQGLLWGYRLPKNGTTQTHLIYTKLVVLVILYGTFT